MLMAISTVYKLNVHLRNHGLNFVLVRTQYDNS